MSTSSKTIKFYLRENLQHKLLFGATVFCWTIGLILQKLLMPLVVARAFNVIIKAPNLSQLSLGTFRNDLLIFGALLLISQTLLDGGLYLLSRLETKVTPQLYQKVYDRLLAHSMNFHANTFSGALVTQSNRFINAYVGLTDAFIINILQMTVLVFISAIVLSLYAPILAIAMVTWAVGFVSLNIILTRRRIKLARIAAAAESAVTAHLADSLSNVGVIKSFSHGPKESKAYRKLADYRAKTRYNVWMRGLKNDFTFGMLMGVLQAMIVILSFYLVKQGRISVGTLLLAQVYATQIMASLWGLSSLTRNIEQQLSDAGEMTEILEVPLEVVDAQKVEPARISQGSINFRNVSFTYEEDAQSNLFEDLNLSITPGEKIGLIGHSGGGKTSITKLLLRFMDIQGGAIEIDGQNIAAIKQDDLRQHIAYVPQEPLLFHRSLSENIRYGRPGASDEDVIKIAKLAHAHEFVTELPDGYDTLVGERGVKLSGGQRQRVAIARAMIKDAPILVLDEATSALDSESEALIQDALWKLMEGRTAIVIAHRLSTIQKMDRIIVMDNGKIAEQGTHTELLKNKGIYAQLWARQSGGFLDE